MRLAGKVAIVTGVASGIGRASAILFAKEGARVVAADIADTAGIETVDIINSSVGEAVFVHTDVSLASEVSNLIKASIDNFGKIDILFNNAGIYFGFHKLEDIDESSWERLLAVNAKSIFLAAKYAVPEMKRAGGGVIINTASTAGFKPVSRSSAYAASKGAVIALTKALAIELAEYNIRVNCISPDATDTAMIALPPPSVGQDGASRDKVIEELAKDTPLGRINKPDDIACAALYLASDESSMLTGVNINIDGGRGI
ncbi:SDR family NAD(P)-dependent oxidoreductase [Chloroflexota bacterium]